MFRFVFQNKKISAATAEDQKSLISRMEREVKMANEMAGNTADNMLGLVRDGMEKRIQLQAVIDSLRSDVTGMVSRVRSLEVALKTGKKDRILQKYDDVRNLRLHDWGEIYAHPDHYDTPSGVSLLIWFCFVLPLIFITKLKPIVLTIKLCFAINCYHKTETNCTNN